MKEKKERNERMLKLFLSGYSYDDLGTYFGISRQAAYKVIKREIKRRRERGEDLVG